MVKKALIKNKVYDVISQSELQRRYKMANGSPEVFKETCVEKNGTLYPVQEKFIPDKQGPYCIYNGLYGKYVGSANDDADYSSNKIINFSDSKSIQELLEKQNHLRADMACTLNSNSDNTFTPIIREEDSPALKCVKESLKAKNIDIDYYRNRFDSNCDYSNTLRLLTNPENHNISVPKIQLIGEKFDINFKLIAEDKPNAPNPMNNTIEKEL